MNFIELPPPSYLMPQIVRQIDFDPCNGTFDLYGFTSGLECRPRGRNGTSSSPYRSIDAVHSVGSPLRIHTSSSALDQAVASRPAMLDVPGQLAEVKRLTGYGWEKIAELLGCSRQAVHKWTLGERISNVNGDRLAKLLATIRFIDRGSAEDNRALLSSSFEGQTLAERLVEEDFENVRSFAGRGMGRPDEKWGAVRREKVSVADHWFTRLLESDGSEDSVVVRAKPQDIKRLQLSKG
jgi:predicted transcriptional regulator